MRVDGKPRLDACEHDARLFSGDVVRDDVVDFGLRRSHFAGGAREHFTGSMASWISKSNCLRMSDEGVRRSVCPLTSPLDRPAQSTREPNAGSIGAVIDVKRVHRYSSFPKTTPSLCSGTHTSMPSFVRTSRRCPAASGCRNQMPSEGVPSSSSCQKAPRAETALCLCASTSRQIEVGSPTNRDLNGGVSGKRPAPAPGGSRVAPYVCRRRDHSRRAEFGRRPG